MATGSEHKSKTVTIGNRIDNTIIWITVATVFLVPLTFGVFRVTATYSELKILTLHLMAMLIVILWSWRTVLWSYERKQTGSEIGSWDLVTWAGSNPARWAIVAVAITAVFQVASTLLSPLTIISFFGGDEARTGYNLYDSLSMLIIFFTIALRFRSRRQIGFLLWAVIASGTLAAIYGVTQHFGWAVLGYAGTADQGRVISSFGNTLNFGAFMVMTIPCTLAMVYHTRCDKTLWISPLTIALSIQLAGIWFTGGRGAYTGLLMGMIVFFMLGLYTLGAKRVARSATVFVVGIFFTIIIAALPSPHSGPSLERTLNRSFELQQIAGRPDYLKTSSTEIVGGLRGRLQIWDGSLEIARSWPAPGPESPATRLLRPVFGLGPDMFVYSYPLVGPPQPRLQSVDHVHNYPLQILMEQGYAGFILLVATAGLILIAASRTVQTAKRDPVQLQKWTVPLLALIPAVLGKMVEMQAGVNRISDLTTTFALAAGVIVLFELVNSGNVSSTRDPVNGSGSARSHRIIFGGTFIIAVVLTVSLITLFSSWDLRRLSASRSIAMTWDSEDQSIKASGWADGQAKAPERESFTHTLANSYLREAELAYDQGYTEPAIEYAKIARELLLEYENLDPFEWDVQMLLAKSVSRLVAWGELQYIDEMADRYQRTAEFYPMYPSIVGTAATALTSVDRHELAIYYADKAIEAEATTQPWSKAWYAKGRALFELGREEEAITALKIGTEKQPGWEGSLLCHQVLGQIYTVRGEEKLAEFHRSQGAGPILFKE